MTLRLSDRALRDLAGIHAYYAGEGRPEVGESLVNRLLGARAALQQHPRLGRESRLRRRRELVVDEYIAIYSLHREDIVVRTVIHGARQRKES